MNACPTSPLVDKVLDGSIVLSFDRSGFQRHAASFAKSDLDVDLSGRVCLITGANSGIGFETALALAARRATVWLLCRNRERGDNAAREIRRRTGSRRVHAAELDVSDLRAVRRFVRDLEPRVVDVLVHNAGVLPDSRMESPAGHELTFATHVLGPDLLTRLLLPKLRLSGDARVVFVSSGGMYTQRLSVADVGWQQRPYDGVVAYAQTKRMQVVLAEQLAEEMRPHGISVNSMHPGWADTPAVRSSLPRFWRVMQRRLRTPAEGADTAIWLAASPAARGQTGRFWFDRSPRPTHLLPWTKEARIGREAFSRLCASALLGYAACADAAIVGGA